MIMQRTLPRRIPTYHRRIGLVQQQVQHRQPSRRVEHEDYHQQAQRPLPSPLHYPIETHEEKN